MPAITESHYVMRVKASFVYTAAIYDSQRTSIRRCYHKIIDVLDHLHIRTYLLRLLRRIFADLTFNNPLLRGPLFLSVTNTICRWQKETKGEGIRVSKSVLSRKLNHYVRTHTIHLREEHRRTFEEERKMLRDKVKISGL